MANFLTSLFGQAVVPQFQFYKAEEDFQRAVCRPPSSLAFKEHGNAQHQLNRHVDSNEELRLLQRSLDSQALRYPVSQAQDYVLQTDII